MTTSKKRRYPASIRFLERGQGFARRSLDAWTNYSRTMLSASGALVASDDYTWFNWTETAWLVTSDTYFETFEALASLWSSEPAAKSIQLEFDPNAEMAGPASVELGEAPKFPPTVPGPLVGTPGNQIPKDHVVVRVQGTTLIVTLVNLRYVMGRGATIPPGEYRGEIVVDGNKLPVVATCADEPGDPYRRQIIDFIRGLVAEVTSGKP
jgi:hypothetical protein